MRPSACSVTASVAVATALVVAPTSASARQQSFTNWETPHVSPLALDVAGERLFACNTPDNRLEVFDISGTTPVHLFDVPVGLDPVSVRQRTANEVWVVNGLSDSVSVVDLTLRAVVATVDTEDEPADVVFAGTPERAFVTCAQPNLVQVFDPVARGAPTAEIRILGEEPRAMAVSADGSQVYVAVFESGNGSTILGGGLDPAFGSPQIRNVVSDPLGPYGGQNPPPNEGANFVPPMTPGNPPPPAVGLVVKKDGLDRWKDDNGGDWTDLVSGPNAARSDRPVGWDVTDHDVAVIDTTTLAVTYADRLMNINMALAVHPTTGSVTVVGTDCTNEVRFEPNLNGRFLRVRMASVDLANDRTGLVDLNRHLDYQSATVPEATRELSIGDPRGVAWSADGARAYVTGMGSNNVVVLDGAGTRAGAPIEVGEGPTGIAVVGHRAFVLNKFDSSISTLDLLTATETSRVAFHDPSPEAIKIGRKHLYGTHEGSGLGHVACASCHVDSKTDRMAWDLGDPAGAMRSDDHLNLGLGLAGLTTGFEDFHPMKGPMATQTLQDIIGKEPLHWRGDRDSLHDFAGAFTHLQGAVAQPSPSEVDEFEAFLATIHFPPNPFRTFENGLPTALDLSEHLSVGRFTPAGTPLPVGNAQTGLDLSKPPFALVSVFACVTCHTTPTGLGPNARFQGGLWAPFTPGPNGEANHGLIAADGSTNRNMKVPQLRNLYKKVGMDFMQTEVQSGFGFLHDGSIPSLAHFLSSSTIGFQSEQALADMTAFMLAFSGSDLPEGASNAVLFPPGTASRDTHAGVGTQITVTDWANAPQGVIDLVTAMQSEADLARVGLVARGLETGTPRGYAYLGGASFQADRIAEQVPALDLLSAATPAAPLTLTVVPFGAQQRIGVDRDEDGFLDRDELDAGSDPANGSSVPDLGTNYCGPAVANASGAPGVISAVGSSAASDGELTLVASSLPTNSAGYFVASMTQDFVVGPGGSAGNLCIGGSVARFAAQLQNSGLSGSFSIDVDLDAIPTNPSQQVLAGQTWNFQAWFRDSAMGQPTSNFTDALSIAYQ
ncbi:MAG: YncE family protein [Planctomycetota bacterium]